MKWEVYPTLCGSKLTSSSERVHSTRNVVYDPLGSLNDSIFV